MKNDIDLSIIIVSYNCLNYLIDCLDSIILNNDIGDRLEIIVVDNSDNEDTSKYINSNYKDIVFVKNENKGFGQANNVGSRLASGRYLLFLNPDTLIIEPFFSKVLRIFENGCVCFGVQLIDVKHKKANSFGLIHPLGFKNILFGKVFHFLNWFIQPKMFISGADIFIKKDVFLNIGMFDDNIFMYFEETDLFTRLKTKKYKWRFFKNMRIVHLEGKATPNGFVKKYKIQIESYINVCKKNDIDYVKELKKELRYRKFRFNLTRLTKSNNCSDYANICCFLKEKISGVNNA